MSSTESLSAVISFCFIKSSMGFLIRMLCFRMTSVFAFYNKILWIYCQLYRNTQWLLFLFIHLVFLPDLVGPGCCSAIWRYYITYLPGWTILLVSGLPRWFWATAQRLYTLHLPLTVILYWHTCSCVSACILDILDIIYLSLFPSIACHNLDISRYLSFTFARLQKQYYWFLGCNCSFDKVLERLNIISNVHEGWRWKMYFLFQHLNIMYYADIYSKAVVMYTR